ncbi:hypothetical protein ACG7TL_007446 [Trametes sanguinea]
MRDLLRSYIAALYLEIVLFGAFSVTYAAGVWSIMRVDHPGKPSAKDRAIALVSTVMRTLALTHVMLTLKLASDGFANNAGSLESMYDALTYQSLWFQSTLGRARFVIYVTQTLIGDAFMIFRVFVVWGGKTRIIILPALLVITDAVAGCMSVDIAFAAFMPIVFFCFSFFTNVVCTVLIMWRTLRSAYGSAPPKLMSRRFTLKHRKVVEAILQSAAIYSAASVVLIITYFTSPTVGFNVCVGVFPSLIGLVFSFIVLRLAKRSRESAPRLTYDQRPREAPVPMQVIRERLRTPTSPSFSIHLPPLVLEQHPNRIDLESRADWQESALAVDKVHVVVMPAEA